MKKLLIIVIAIVILAVGWYLISPLFISNTVDEAFPTSDQINDQVDVTADVDLPVVVDDAIEPEDTDKQMEDDMAMMKNLTVDDVEKLTKGEKRDLQKKMDDLAASMPDTVTAEAMPAGPTAVSVGQFIDADSFHKGSGQATVYSLEDGEQLLRLEDFSVTNGPALHVYLVKDASGDVDSGFIDLGDLKGNMGNQNYTIDSAIDTSEYNSVVIWCKPFAVTFATASLN